MGRIYYLDLAKVVAVLLVVFTHLKENLGYYGATDYVRILTYYIDRIGVPVFLWFRECCYLVWRKNSR
ncbi:acyltransferase family protein [Serratia microhaemolytica]|uniref:acyltransferase family protein n=1 Tax=Serratia microhaemolytica TaxID=2675110 RepID=UPI003B8362D9